MKAASARRSSDDADFTTRGNSLAIAALLCRDERIAPWETTLTTSLFGGVWREALRHFRSVSGSLRQNDNAAVLHEIIAHSRRTARYVRAIALRQAELQGCDRANADAYAAILGASATFHDIGKFAMPARLLGKPGRLDVSELNVVKHHPTVGANMIGRARGRFPPVLVQTAWEMAAFHHERWNGSGYPRGLKGKQIPFVARVAAIADAYDALSHDRVYQPARSHDEAVELISGERGVSFDPHLVEIFLQIAAGLHA
ncbi:HD-GYP domain-containing protein [Paraburkholderia sp. J10-1]|uniref:HD-GYP domain-containing protein n=1 Tax=Paraburkholderia sp. J10-1 TaxID=2805430 RepID=UPI002AB77723|nr:HD domain-containing phosphohydrolase [Paraburkholderia sp. J10-1]